VDVNVVVYPRDPLRYTNPQVIYEASFCFSLVNWSGERTMYPL